jgi:hypothetical protein
VSRDDDWDDADEDVTSFDAANARYDGVDLDVLPAFAPTTAHEGESSLDAFDPLSQAQDEDADAEPIPVAIATNPPGTVSVTAHLNGSIAQIDLDPRVTHMSETELAQEVQAVAEVAAKKATAVLHVSIVRMLVDQGMDIGDARDFVQTHMPYATPDQAVSAERDLVNRHRRYDSGD